MESIWSESVKFKERKSLDKNIKTDVLVIGAGIAGILTAYLLKESGRGVVLIDSEKTCSGNIKNTTAKITSQHDLVYGKIIKEFGLDKAIQYAKANELAIKTYKDIIKKRNIDCDFEEKSAYIYSLSDTDKIKEEAEAAKKAGINAEFVTETSLPFEDKVAVKFNNQAQFNPLKFLKDISEDLIIYENTRALEIREKEVITDNVRIEAEHIVVATHYPIMNTPGYYFMKMHQDRSYVLALDNVKPVDGMFIDYDKEGYSFRMYKNLLLFGGASHRTGENPTGIAYEKLREAAKKIFPHAVERYHWSAQDCMTVDGMPYIGRYSKKTPNVYVATGFNKWGMTSAMVSAFIIRDMILGKENDFSDIFAPTRFDLSVSISNIAKDMSETSKNFIAEKVYIPESHVEHIKKGHAGVVDYNGKKAGVYKDKDGKIFAVSTKCPHLGCQLQWNPDDLAWECPCHGSRFTYEGKRIDSPAIIDIV